MARGFGTPRGMEDQKLELRLNPSTAEFDEDPLFYLLLGTDWVPSEKETVAPLSSSIHPRQVPWPHEVLTSYWIT